MPFTERLKYEILGQLRVVDDRGSSFISARKIETLLAVLLIRSDQVVPSDQLITEIWGETVPRRATAALHVYISQLRKFLKRPGRLDSPIVTRSAGYLLATGDDEVDYQFFIRYADAGRAAARAGRHDDAAVAFEAALALWRGPVLADLRYAPMVDGFATWLMDARLECMELQADSLLHLGRHRELVGKLYSLTAEYPLREGFYRQLMLALYRSECRADALKVYQSARDTLGTELGLEPCRALQELQQAILRADSDLDARVPAG